MKRLLTYGLLLLTILASHFVVSACQDDLPETTDIMVTFTTRAISGGTASTAPEIEQMHDLRVIMLRSDGTIVDKGQYTPEGDFNPSSVRFTFSTTIPNPSGEDFTFLAIANKTSIGQLDNLSIGDNLTQSDIKDLIIDTDVNNEPIPQTDYWTVHVPQTQNHQVKDTLKFAASKISVVFQNETKEPQSLRNIHITGITPNTRGYLFKQENRDDYIDSKLMDNDNAVSTISFGDLSLDAPNTNDKTETVYDIDSIPYYTYPLAASNFDSPKLYATWGDDTRELDLSGITSLARNEHLRIFITLTPAGDITVNYTIAAWEETPTNIGDKAPTTPGNGYQVDTWGASNDIEIGGGGGKSWDIGTGTPIVGEQMWEYELGGQNPEISDRISVHLPEDILVLGNKIILYFYCHTPNGDIPENGIIIQFKNSEDTVLKESVAEEDISYAWDETKTIRYVRYLTFNADVLSKLKKAWNSPEGTKALIVKPVNPDNTQQAVQIRIDQLVVIRPLND